MIIPPFDGVALIEYRDRIELTPYYWVRHFVGIGKYPANRVGPQPGDDMYPFFRDIMGSEDLWLILTWKRYEDGREEAVGMDCLDASTTEEEAIVAYEQACQFCEIAKERLQELATCMEVSDEDQAYIENLEEPGKPGLAANAPIEERDLYQARLKVLAGLQPKTVALIHRAEIEKDPSLRASTQREAVQAYFAEMAQKWTEDQVRDWQRSNPIGTEWLCHFADVMREPEKEIDPINQELALNWLRRKYDLMTAEELSDAILVATGQRLMPSTLKKRRERLGLTTKRLPGPRPRVE